MDKEISTTNPSFATPDKIWTPFGVSEDVRIILDEDNTLFQSLMGKINDNHELKDLIKRILMLGDRVIYNADIVSIMDATRYGFVRNENGALVIDNRIFETRLYNYFLSVEEIKKTEIYSIGLDDRNNLIENGHLMMDKLMDRFSDIYYELYGNIAETFKEDEGRRRFLLYIRPIINGTGNYYIEARTRNNKQMDLVIDYHGERFVIELKIWRGEAYHKKGEQQLADYIKSLGLTKGYMLTYSFNKDKEVRKEHVYIDGMEISEVFV